MTRLNSEGVEIERDARQGFLDILRFVAALSVVLFHYGFRGHAAGDLMLSFPELSFARYGYLGVELFFMISGYVIVWSVGGRPLAKFAVHRFIRLYPTFWFCALLTLLVEHGAHLARFYPGPISALANITMVPNWFGFNEIDAVYWSLAVELEFYILIGVVVWAVGFKRLPMAILGWFVCGCLLTRHPGAVPCYIYYPYFCFGATCYLIQRNGHSLKLTALAVASLCMSAWQAAAMLPQMQSTYHVYFGSVVCAAVIVVSGILILWSGRISRLLGPRMNGIAMLLGGLTYPLYLLHQMIGYTIMDTLFRQSDRWLGLVVTIGVVLAGAAAVYLWFDKPVRAMLRGIVDPWLYRRHEARVAL